MRETFTHDNVECGMTNGFIIRIMLVYSYIFDSTGFKTFRFDFPLITQKHGKQLVFSVVFFFVLSIYNPKANFHFFNIFYENFVAFIDLDPKIQLMTIFFNTN